MRKVLFLFAIIMIGCKNEEYNSYDLVTILNSAIIINHYEDDSLNNSRSLVLPVVYFNFSAINSSDSLFHLVINTFKEEEPPKLFVTFYHGGKKDTLILEDYQSFKVNRIIPNDTSWISIAGFMPKLLSKNVYKDYSPKQVMKSIAETGEIFYFPDPSDQIILKEGYLIKDTIQIKRSQDFSIRYRNPEDTAVE